MTRNKFYLFLFKDNANKKMSKIKRVYETITWQKKPK